MTAGGGLSLLVHAGLLTLLTGRSHVTATADLPSSTVTIDLQATALEQPAQPSATETPAQAPPRTTIHSLARRTARVVTSFAHQSPITTEASPEPDDPADEGDDQGDDQGETAAAPTVAGIEEERLAPPTKAPVIAPDAARALRVYDTYPMLLAQASLTRAEILVEVCVSDHGQVSDAVIAQGGMAAIDHTLRTAIRSWRYRPLVVNGAPTPFCHFMRIKYALN
jgi:hypothetical protein